MDTQGRHIMINCVGEGNNPPASANDLCRFVADWLNSVEQPITAGDVFFAISLYEKGERSV